MNKSIGIFDSGYGGLSVLREIIKVLPEYDYKYLGDNLRAPYGTRSFETVYEFTLQCVKWFFKQDCPLVVLACNTASAKALRTLQQNDLAAFGDEKRVLGVIRPTSEVMGLYTKTGHIGLFGTTGTVQSGSYVLEINKFFPGVSVVQEACPMWVPLVESNEHSSEGADFFVKQHVDRLLKADPEIDTIILACTHYPLLLDKIEQFVPGHIKVMPQGEIVAQSLKNYLERHSSLSSQLSKEGKRRFYTTGDASEFDEKASVFYGEKVVSEHIIL